jgi:hypothetical protein
VLAALAYAIATRMGAPPPAPVGAQDAAARRLVAPNI